MRRVAFVAVVAFLSAVPAFFLSAVPAFGQGFATGEFNGSVVDASGAILPGVTITAQNVETTEVRTTATSPRNNDIASSASTFAALKCATCENRDPN